MVQTPFTIGGQDLFVNSADSKSYGVDLGLRFDSAATTGSAYNFFGEVAYSYVNAEFTGDADPAEGGPQGIDLDGNRMPEVPEHVAALTLGMEHAAGWHISATLSYFDSFYTDVSNTRELTLADEDGVPFDPSGEIEIREPAVLGQVPSHTVLSARASYTCGNILGGTSETTVWIQGRNLTDKLYISDLSNGVRPGPERTIVGGVTVTF